MNEHFNLHPRTMLAIKALGVLLARDLAEAGTEDATTAQARMRLAVQQTLQLLDQLADGADGDNDRELHAMALEPGDTWLDLAERGLISRTYVEHVVRHVRPMSGVMGEAPMPAWVRSLLNTVDVADDDVRDELALAFPEYVGLVRAARMQGAVPRMQALLGVEA